MLKVIGTNESHEQMQCDWPEIAKQHKQAMRTQPLWRMFGGTITVDGRDYQVVDDSPHPVSRVMTVRTPRRTAVKRRRAECDDDLGRNV